MENKQETPISQRTKLLLKLSKQKINARNDTLIEEENAHWVVIKENNLVNYKHANLATSSTETCVTNPVVATAVFCTESTEIDASTSNLESENLTEKLETDASISNLESESVKCK